EVVPGTPRVGVGFNAALQPANGRLAVAIVEREPCLVRVRPRKGGRQPQALVEESRRALRVAVTQIALLGDHEQRLGALRDGARAAETNAYEAVSRLLVRRRGCDARALLDHQPPEAHVALVGEPLAVPPDAVGGVRLAQRSQAKGFEDVFGGALASC